MDNPFETETAKTQIEQAADYLSDAIRREFLDTLAWEDMEPGLESPIEVAFWAWWTAVQRVRGEFSYDYELLPQQDVTVGDGITYRLDFEVTPTNPDDHLDGKHLPIPWPQIAIELDGHDWHERTKDQVILRNQRDRDLQAAGWKVFHFSGTELLRNPKRCVHNVRDYTDGAMSTWFRALRHYRETKRTA